MACFHWQWLLSMKILIICISQYMSHQKVKLWNETCLGRQKCHSAPKHGIASRNVFQNIVTQTKISHGVLRSCVLYIHLNSLRMHIIIFLAPWYLFLLGNPTKDKLCLLNNVDLVSYAFYPCIAVTIDWL